MSKLYKVLLSAQNIIFRIKLQYIFWKKRCIFLLDLFKLQISFMKRIITLSLLFCFLISCERKEPDFSDEMIEKLSLMKEDEELGLLPSQYLTLDLYILTSDKQICRTNNHDLFLFFKKYYFKKYKSFDSFLNDVLNENLILIRNPNYWYNFKLNRKIEKEYFDLGFDKFLKKYSKQSIRKDRFELNRSDLKTDEYFTIKYLLYINKYDISSDCYLGIDYIRKREDSFK